MNPDTRLDIVVRSLELLRKDVEQAYAEGRLEDAVLLSQRLENDWLRLGASASAYWSAEQKIQQA